VTHGDGLAILFTRRVWIVALLGVAAGLTAWFLAGRQQSVYEQTSSFVLRPGAVLTDAQVPDATRGLSQDSGQVGNTITGVLASNTFLNTASKVALGRPAEDAYSVSSSIRPGSDIIDVTFRGPSPDVLNRISDRYTIIARNWAADTYRAYALEFLGSNASSAPVSPKPLRAAALAALLGLLLGAGAIVAEHRARRTAFPSAALESTDKENVNGVIAVDVLTGRADRLEGILRGNLEDGEQIVRVSPHRLGIVRASRVKSSGKK
jgi:capsular polysaccharide biosynthesis protein